MSDLTPEYLTQIRERLEAASSQPWRRRSEPAWGDVSHSVLAVSDMEVALTGYGPDGGTAHQDAELIAHAPTDLEALLDEVDRLRTEVEQVKAVAEDEWTEWTVEWESVSKSRGVLQVKNDKLRDTVQRVRKVAEAARSRHCEPGTSVAAYNLARDVLVALDGETS